MKSRILLNNKKFLLSLFNFNLTIKIFFLKNTTLTLLLGIGDWGLGIGDWAQSPIPNPHIYFQIINID